MAGVGEGVGVGVFVGVGVASGSVSYAKVLMSLPSLMPSDSLGLESQPARHAMLTHAVNNAAIAERPVLDRFTCFFLIKFSLFLS